MRRLFRYAVLLAGLAFLTGCAFTAEPVWAPDEEVARARFVSDEPPSITLITVINNNTGGGAHTALLINGSQRVIFDPAGTWYHPYLPERNDVHYGMSDAAVAFYIDYHTRQSYRTITQKVYVTREVADIAIREAEAYGAVPKGMCSISTTTILANVPGFESIRSTWFPKALMRDFAALPGVETETFIDNDPDDNSGFILAYGIRNLNM